MNQGKPLQIGDELDKQVQQYVKHMRETGVAVNTDVVIAAAEGILINQDADSNNELSKPWAKYLLK